MAAFLSGAREFDSYMRKYLNLLEAVLKRRCSRNLCEAHEVSLAERILGVMAQVRRIFREARMRKPNTTSRLNYPILDGEDTSWNKGKSLVVRYESRFSRYCVRRNHHIERAKRDAGSGAG